MQIDLFYGDKLTLVWRNYCTIFTAITKLISWLLSNCRHIPIASSLPSRAFAWRLLRRCKTWAEVLIKFEKGVANGCLIDEILSTKQFFKLMGTPKLSDFLASRYSRIAESVWSDRRASSDSFGQPISQWWDTDLPLHFRLLHPTNTTIKPGYIFFGYTWRSLVCQTVCPNHRKGWEEGATLKKRRSIKSELSLPDYIQLRVDYVHDTPLNVSVH